MQMSAQCIILSAGQSLRMKRHKALLPYGGGENFLEHIVGVYERAGVKEMTIVLNPEIAFENSSQRIHVVKNYFPDLGRMFSLYLAAQAQKAEAGFYFIQNIDNPFVTEELVKTLVTNANENGYTVPVYKGRGGHPVLVSKKVMKNIGEQFASAKTLKEVLLDYERRNVEVEDEWVVANINTAEDYRQYFRQEEIVE